MPTVNVTIASATINLAPEALVENVNIVLQQLRKVLMNQAEMEAALVAAADKTDKIIAEVQAATAVLQAAIAAAGSSTPAVDAALLRLQNALTVADDLNPDGGGVVAP